MSPDERELQTQEAAERYWDHIERLEDRAATPDLEIDPTPWCSGCGSRTKSGCHCGELASND